MLNFFLNFFLKFNPPIHNLTATMTIIILHFATIMCPIFDLLEVSNEDFKLEKSSFVKTTLHLAGHWSESKLLKMISKLGKSI